MKLTDTQTILLAHAAQRTSGSLYPLPDTLTSKAGAAKSITALVKQGLVEERETSEAAETARGDGDLRYGKYVTAAGLAAINVDDADGQSSGTGSGGNEGDGPQFDTQAPSPTPPAKPRATKAAAVLALLQREGGATLAELIDATGWLPHTTRAALTGLRKKGHTLEKSKRDGATCYRVVSAA